MRVRGGGGKRDRWCAGLRALTGSSRVSTPPNGVLDRLMTACISRGGYTRMSAIPSAQNTRSPHVCGPAPPAPPVNVISSMLRHSGLAAPGPGPCDGAPMRSSIAAPPKNQTTCGYLAPNNCRPRDRDEAATHRLNALAIVIKVDTRIAYTCSRSDALVGFAHKSWPTVARRCQ